MSNPSPLKAQAGPAVVSETVESLVQRARALASADRRHILGITGAPGAGKSTVCAALLEALGESSALVGMDGFHLANKELIRLGRRNRKGAPDTFDVDGYVSLLRRLHEQSEDVIYAPVFDRALEESIGSAEPVGRDIKLVITEGNYLLYDRHGWADVRDQLDEVWFLDVAPAERQRRLVKRRVSHGHSPEDAASWVSEVDEANAALVDATRRSADLIVHLAPSGGALNQTGSANADEGVAS